MLFFRNVLLFAATSSAFTVLPRAVGDVISALTKVDNDIKSTTSQVKAWNGTAGGAGPILQTATTLDNDIKAANTTVSQQSVFSAGDSNTVINYVNNNLYPDIQALCAAFQSRKSDADKSGLTNTLLSRLKTIRADITSLITSICAKCASSGKTNCQVAGNKILASLDACTKNYGG